jgi:TonB-linked SusC/RagA family outer membrane protein
VTDAYNPVAFAARTFNTSKVFRTQGNAYLDYTILDGLVFRSNVGLFINNANSYVFNPSFFLAPWEQRANNSVSRGFLEDNGLVWENRLTYTKSTGNHNITAMVGFTSEEYNNEGFSGSKQTIPSNDESFRVLQAATTADQITGNKNSYSLLSQFTRINYGYKDKYLLTATYRVDGSSRFAENNRWGKFPSAAVGWRINNENFFKNLNAQFIDNLKIRVGWGQIGNQNIPNYSYLSLISGGNSRRYTIGDVPLQGYSPSSVGNPNIKWETVEQTNIGLDVGLFGDRLSMSLDYYTKKTKDMLLSVPLPYYLGYPANPWSNEGSIENKGIELQLDYRNSTPDFSYSLGLNFTTISNEVISLGSGGAIFGGQSRMGLVTKTEEGHPIGSFYGFVMDGIFQNENEVATSSQPNANPGDIRFKDIAGSPDAEGNPTAPDGIINENDRTYLGSPIPDYLIGFNINLQYKRFDLSMFFQGTFGNEIYSATKYFTHAPVGYFNVSKEAYDNAWTGEGTSNNQPIISSNTASDNYRNSSFYVEDGSFMRLKNIQLTYSLPLKGIPTGGLQLYVSCQNLFTFTKYSGLDPELGSSTLLDVGIDYGVYPQSRTLMAGIKFNY